MVHTLILFTLVSQAPEPAAPTAPTAPERDRLEREVRRSGLTEAAVAKMTGEQIHDVLTEGNGEPPAVAVVAVVATFMTLAISIVAGLYAIYRVSQQRAETLRLMIEKGVTIPPELIAPKPRRASDLRRGIVLAMFGLGLGVFLFAVAAEGMWTMALVPLFVGLGYLLAFRVVTDEPRSPAPAAPPATDP